MPIRHIPTYTDGKHEVRFWPDIGNLPGFTHRVIVNRTMVGFLSDKFKPNAKAAKFFIEKFDQQGVR